MIGLLDSLCGNYRRSSLIVALTIFALVAALVLSGCNKTGTAVKDFDRGAEPANRSDVKKGITPQPDEQVAVIETADFGNIVIELYPNVAPQMVERLRN